MAKNFGSNALGRGLKALIKDRGAENDERKLKDLESERHARNMEFYGSMMKKYVRSGEGDDLIEQMLEDVRVHMGISQKEHQNLLKTLRKRENVNPPRRIDQEKAQSEIKEELTKLYKEIHGKKKGKRKKSRFTKMEDDSAADKGEPIALTNGKDVGHRKVKKVLKRRLIARDLDERAGIETSSSKTKKVRLEWLEDEEEAIKMPAPKEGLEDNVVPIRASPPQKGLEDSSDVFQMEAPVEEDDGTIRDQDDGKLEIDRSSGPTLEMPPSTIPEGPGPGFELVDKTSKIEIGPEIGSHSGTEKETEGADEPEELEEAEEVADGEMEELEEDMEEEVESEPVKEEKDTTSELDDSLFSLKMLMEEDRIDEASRMADRLLEKEPGNISILNEKGVILYHQGQIHGSLEIYSAILDKEPDSVETLINYAALLSVQGELDSSLECLDRAVKKDPYSEDAWNNKAVVLTRAGRLREALECLDEALRINEKTPSTWMNAGIILEKMGEIGPAMECYKNLLELEPENTIALQGIEYCRSILDD